MLKFFQQPFKWALNVIEGNTVKEEGFVDDRKKLLEMLEQARAELINADKGFDEVADNDLAEYYIYFRKAAEARYNYLIKAVKSNLGIELIGMEQKLKTDEKIFIQKSF